jgi:hypothetical protein
MLSLFYSVLRLDIIILGPGAFRLDEIKTADKTKSSFLC